MEHRSPKGQISPRNGSRKKLSQNNYACLSVAGSNTDIVLRRAGPKMKNTEDETRRIILLGCRKTTSECPFVLQKSAVTMAIKVRINTPHFQSWGA